MQIGRLEIRIIPENNGLSIVAWEFEDWEKRAKKEGLSKELLSEIAHICYEFRRVGRREGER